MLKKIDFLILGEQNSLLGQMSMSNGTESRKCLGCPANGGRHKKLELCPNYGRPNI